MGLRTAPRPPAQRGVGAAGATMQEGDARIFEPLINLETKKKNKVKSCHNSLLGCSIFSCSRTMKATDVGFVPAFSLGGSLCTPCPGSARGILQTPAIPL